MTLPEFARLVVEMRDAQKAFYAYKPDMVGFDKDRKRGLLQRSLSLESGVDRIAKDILEPEASLFDEK